VRAEGGQSRHPGAPGDAASSPGLLAPPARAVTHLSNPGHQNVIRFLGNEEVGKHIVIYMELANDGELFSKVIAKGALTEDEAMPYFKQLMSAVQYMHSKGVAHRDLKLENVLVHMDECKVCDFGLAHQHLSAEPQLLREVCGSKSYCAPEVLKGEGYYGYPTDVWSCGIVSARPPPQHHPSHEAATRASAHAPPLPSHARPAPPSRARSPLPRAIALPRDRSSAAAPPINPLCVL
jgi:serine/threonine protein kinase